MLQLIGKTSADYFNVLCAKCESTVEIEYLGFDPSIPHFRATCKQCEETATLKLSGTFWHGLPSKPYQSL
jgi:hypothetical protein